MITKQTLYDTLFSHSTIKRTSVKTIFLITTNDKQITYYLIRLNNKWYSQL